MQLLHVYWLSPLTKGSLMDIGHSKQKYVGLKPQKGLERRVYDILEGQAGMLERDIYHRLKIDGAHATRRKIVAALHRLEEREVVSFTLLRRGKKNEKSWSLFSPNTIPTTNDIYPKQPLDERTKRASNVKQIVTKMPVRNSERKAAIFDFNNDWEDLPEPGDNTMNNHSTRWDNQFRVNCTAEFVVMLLKEGNMNQGQLIQKVSHARNEQEEKFGVSYLLSTTNLYQRLLRNEKFLINTNRGRNEQGLWFIHPGKSGSKIFSLQERNFESVKETPLQPREPKMMQADHPAVTELRIRTKDKVFFVASLLLAVVTTAITFSAI